MTDLPPPAIIHQIVVSNDFNINHKQIALQHLETMTDEEMDKDFKLEDFFGVLFIINLPSAHDRLERVAKDLSAIGLTQFQVWQATNGRDPKEVPVSIWSKMSNNWRKLETTTEQGCNDLKRQYQGEAGCFFSHYRLIKHVKELFDTAYRDLLTAYEKNMPELIQEANIRVRKYCSILIMEDDNAFGFVNPDCQTATLDGAGRLLREAISELPENWEMLYFLTMPHKPSQPASQHLKRLSYGWLTSCYAINYRMYDTLLTHLKIIEDPAVTSLIPVDNVIGALHEYHLCFAISPALAYQREGSSQIIDDVAYYLRQHQP